MSTKIERGINVEFQIGPNLGDRLDLCSIAIFVDLYACPIWNSTLMPMPENVCTSFSFSCRIRRRDTFYANFKMWSFKDLNLCLIFAFNQRFTQNQG